MEAHPPLLQDQRFPLTAPSDPPPDYTTAFDRTARAVRRCIALARSLNELAEAAKDPAPPRFASTPLPHDATRQPSGIPGGDSAEALGASLRDRPEPRDRDAPDDDLTNRPIADVIAGICQDLALATPLDARHILANIAQLCTRAAGPSEAAASTTRHPGSRLHRPRPSAAQPRPDPQPNQREPDHPAALMRPIHPGGTLPHDPAEAVATPPRGDTRAEARWALAAHGLNGPQSSHPAHP